MMTDPHLILAAGGALAVRPRSIRVALLPRVLGLYIAACAGGIQFLDIALDRFRFDDRIFTFAIVLAVIGIPFAGAGAVLIDTTRSERRPTGTTTGRSAPLPGPREPLGGPAAPDDVSSRTSSQLADLPRRLELALSYRRIAELHAASGDESQAAVHRDRSTVELESLIEDLRRLLTGDSNGG